MVSKTRLAPSRCSNSIFCRGFNVGHFTFCPFLWNRSFRLLCFVFQFQQQGGGLGWGQERGWGMGADQVLEIEAILADGRHVKFHPIEWESVEGYIYPKTTKVAGYCNANVDADESDWIWGACEEPAPPFEDLWMAFRGGGG